MKKTFQSSNDLSSLQNVITNAISLNPKSDDYRVDNNTKNIDNYTWGKPDGQGHVD